VMAGVRVTHHGDDEVEEQDQAEHDEDDVHGRRQARIARHGDERRLLRFAERHPHQLEDHGPEVLVACHAPQVCLPSKTRRLSARVRKMLLTEDRWHLVLWILWEVAPLHAEENGKPERHVDQDVDNLTAIRVTRLRGTLCKGVWKMHQEDGDVADEHLESRRRTMITSRLQNQHSQTIARVVDRAARDHWPLRSTETGPRNDSPCGL
jgi:hypothetical protein